MLVYKHGTSHLPRDRLMILFGFRCRLLQFLLGQRSYLSTNYLSKQGDNDEFLKNDTDIHEYYIIQYYDLFERR